jgi:hypothetical protein
VPQPRRPLQRRGHPPLCLPRGRRPRRRAQRRPGVTPPPRPATPRMALADLWRVISESAGRARVVQCAAGRGLERAMARRVLGIGMRGNVSTAYQTDATIPRATHHSPYPMAPSMQRGRVYTIPYYTAPHHSPCHLPYHTITYHTRARCVMVTRRIHSAGQAHRRFVEAPASSVLECFG